MRLNRLEGGLLAAMSVALVTAVVAAMTPAREGGQVLPSPVNYQPAQAIARPPRAQPIAGPVAADVVDIVDGDNVRVIAHVWPGHAVSVNVRLRGIDAPEMRSGCAAERKLASEAKAALANLLGSGPVVLVNVEGGRYFGRVVADMRLADGSDLASLMLHASPARRYDGGRRLAWCS